MKDPYKILGIGQSASDEEVKQAYRKKALEWHPDRHSNSKEAEEKFKEINAAYDSIKNPKKQNFNSNNSHFYSNLNDIFSDFFMGGFEHFHNHKKYKNVSNLDFFISLEEAYSGITKNIKYTKKTKCEKCNGAGFEFSKEVCFHCKGKGKITTKLGPMVLVQTCYACKGDGKKRNGKCEDCSGKGNIFETKNVEINIPAGIGNGEIINVNSELNIQIKYRDHLKFKIKNLHTRSFIDVDIFDAVTGTSLEVDTLAGKKKIKIPSGIGNGQLIKLDKMGMKNKNNKKGDHFVEINLKVPKLNEKQIEIIKKIKNDFKEQE